MAANRPDDVPDGGGYRHSDQQRRHTDKYRDNKRPDRDFSHICEQPFVEELMPWPQRRSDHCNDHVHTQSKEDRKSMLGRGALPKVYGDKLTADPTGKHGQPFHPITGVRELAREFRLHPQLWVEGLKEETLSTWH